MYIIAETERLYIRRFHGSDLDTLCAIMQKPAVMYAWEHEFHRDETFEWLNRQFIRYEKDGYGYYAVMLKDARDIAGGADKMDAGTNVRLDASKFILIRLCRMIGQVGLLKSELDGVPVMEIGYIFDDTVWGHGYAAEAARACVDLAFHRFGADKLYATIRPENAASVNVAVKLGMKKTGEYVKTYRDKAMPHDIYMIENPACKAVK